MNAMILAAGLGTRLSPYTAHTPKALFTINQQPLLGIVIEQLKKAGFKKVLVNTHHLHRQIEDFVQRTPFGIPIILQHEPDILGTGGGIRNTSAHWLPGPLLVINADIITDIDLEKVVRFHRGHDQAVTMVMHDHAEFNSVGVKDGLVVRFNEAPENSAPEERLAFTGIHVIDSRVLDFLPESGPAHIIDAYSSMIAAGEKICAYRVNGHQWHDIGSPGRYIDAVYSKMAPLAFEKAFGILPPAPVRRQRLHGDGSDRQWYRLYARERTLIMADHHIRPSKDRQEVDAYVEIGRHLHAVGAAVPEIYLHDNCAGLVFLQDLGDRHLQKEVAGLDLPQKKAVYERVIDQWLTMALKGAGSFDPAWTFQTQRYDRSVVLQNECRYFIEAFVRGYLGWDLRFRDFADEFNRLADRIMQITATGFMHRDLQSRNILVNADRIHFIDFQGGRIGPLQYDLASLLIDPYVALAPALQADLRTYCAHSLERRYGIDSGDFNDGYACCALSRNLQILGAFAFLGGTKGKTAFYDYIPQAVESLAANHAAFEHVAAPRLNKLAGSIAQHIQRQSAWAR